jgi:hypothetical protein
MLLQARLFARNVSLVHSPSYPIPTEQLVRRCNNALFVTLVHIQGQLERLHVLLALSVHTHLIVGPVFAQVAQLVHSPLHSTLPFVHRVSKVLLLIYQVPALVTTAWQELFKVQ